MAYAMGGEKSRIRSAAPGETFTAGQLVALASDGKLYKANAALADSYPALGLAEIDATSDDVTKGTLIAVVQQCDYCTGATGLTPGATLWAGETDGTVTTTRPSTHADIVQPVGMALTATTFILNVGGYYEQVGVTQDAPD